MGMAQTSRFSGLPSPATSVGSSVRGGPTTLPAPRSHPLKPGSSKEIAAINYIDDKILRITRRYAKKFSNTDSDGDAVPGYTNFDQVLFDIEPIFDIVWISGTPSLQIPYTLTLAGFFCSYMRAFALTQAMFRVARKFDLAFSSLLKPTENATNSSHHISITEKVRIKSLIEETRVNAVRVAAASGIEATLETPSETESSSDDGDEDGDEDSIPKNPDFMSMEKVARSVGKIYELTLDTLGDVLGTISVPAMTDDAALLSTAREEEDGDVIEL